MAPCQPKQASTKSSRWTFFLQLCHRTFTVSLGFGKWSSLFPSLKLKYWGRQTFSCLSWINSISLSTVIYTYLYYSYPKIMTYTYAHNRYTTKSKSRNILSCTYVYTYRWKRIVLTCQYHSKAQMYGPMHLTWIFASGAFSLGLKEKLRLGIMGGKWVLTCLPNLIPCQDHYVEKHWWSCAWAPHKRVLIFIMSIYIWGAFMIGN